MSARAPVTHAPGTRPLRIAVVTNILPSYHRGFYDRLLARDDVRITVYCQPALLGMNVRAIHERYPTMVHLVDAVGLAGERVVWQRLPWRRIARDHDVVFVAGNPRHLAHALLATWLRLRGRPVVLWTMALSYRANEATARLRLAWSRLFRHLLVYTDREADYLRSIGFRRQDVLGMNNGLDQEAIARAAGAWTPERLRAWTSAQGLDGRTVLLSVARLEPKNRFDLMVDAMERIAAGRPDVVWCLVGDGHEDEALRRQVEERSLGPHVRFLGPKFGEDELAPWFRAATLAVHPAAIGLGLLHAFGYGVPLVTHGNARTHGPEFAAFAEGETGFTYREGEAGDLADTVLAALAAPERLRAMGARARAIAETRYNSGVMAERFVAIARRAAGGPEL